MKGVKIQINPNERHNHLIVLEEVDRANDGARQVLCLCDCGNKFVTRLKSVMYGDTKSCGCMRKTKKDTSKRRERLYGVWASMKGRCNNPNHYEYKHYGAKGIRVCEEWNEYPSFREWAYANGYDENAPRNKCTIDRIDSKGNYEPSNCRWVDFNIQSNNTSRNCLIEYQGTSHTMAEWSRITGINYSTMRTHVEKGKSFETLLNKYNVHL